MPSDWARAALEAIAEGGMSAVTVEALGPKVGASKGSFYWHFQDRAALLEAALELWEEERTEAIMAASAVNAPALSRDCGWRANCSTVARLAPAAAISLGK